MRKHTIAAALLSATLGCLSLGCAFEDGRAFDEDSDTLHSRLADRQTLVLEPPSAVGITALNADGATVPCVQPEVESGLTLLRATDDGLLVVDEIEVELSDLHVPASETTYPEDLTLTDVRVRLGTQLVVAPEWSFDGSFALGRGRADLLLDWSVLGNSGEVLPLATQLLRDVEFHVHVEVDSDNDERLIAEVRTDVPGSLWDFSIIELTDLSMHLLAEQLPAP